ncbi:hypothetical protein [Pseudoxanthomonas mexicana]
MKAALALITLLLSNSAFAGEPIYLECQIPEKSGSYTGVSGKQVTTNSPAVTLAVTLNEAESKASQVFRSGDDNYSFTADAQFTPTEILYQSTRKRGFVRTDRFTINRTTLAVKFVVEYPSMGTLQARDGTCKIVPRTPTQI